MSRYKFHWPNVRKSLFDMEGDKFDSPTKCFIDHMGLSHFGHDYLSGQYKRAADQLVDFQKDGGDIYQPDGLFMPIVYLYRHAIELKLKGLLIIIIQCEMATDPENYLGKHNIMKLWEILKKAIIDEWPESDKSPINNTESLLNDFQRTDKTGQYLRYSHSKEGQDVRAKFPKVVRLEVLQDACNEIFGFFDCSVSHFSSIRDYIIESQRECY